MKIIKTSEALPKSGRYVLAWLEGAKIPMRAMWAAQHTLPLGDDADPEWGEYSEEKDEYFCPAGWYEMNQHEEQHWGVSGNVVAWCELPRLHDQFVAHIELAGAAPAAVAPQGERQWICPTRTVADLVNNLLTMDQALPVYGAQYIEKDGRRCAIAVPPTVSRERVLDGRWIGQGEELNAAVVWTRAEQPAAVAGPALALVERQALEALCAVAVAASHAADDSSDEGASFIQVQRADFEKLDAALDLLDELPDDQPGSAMLPGAKGKWALRRLLDAAPALEAPAAPPGFDAWWERAGDGRSKLMAKQAWHAALAAAPQAPAAPAEAQRLAQFLKDRQTCLGSSRASAGKYNQESWDDYERAWTMLLGMAAPAAPAVDAFTHAELLEIKRAVEEFADCNETDVDYALLLRAAQAGYLECTQFHVLNQSALDLDTVAAAQAKEGGDQ